VRLQRQSVAILFGWKQSCPTLRMKSARMRDGVILTIGHTAQTNPLQLKLGPLPTNDRDVKSITTMPSYMIPMSHREAKFEGKQCKHGNTAIRLLTQISTTQEALPNDRMAPQRQRDQQKPSLTLVWAWESQETPSQPRPNDEKWRSPTRLL
jgi:hypothetical protein